MARKEDLRTALHHIAHLTHHGFRGTCQMYESSPDEFTVLCDLTDNMQMTRNGDPFVRMCRERLLNTNPNAIVECRDYQSIMIYNNGPEQAPTNLHRVFLRVRHREDC